ncbi:MAG TPA: cytochrome C oxidase subunit IV family protein [Verrucomicrobiae bacterium]|nr:cytochrome C oxidase subunit IV family protein [Verrucomicrobiae bacterium]
MNPSHPEDITQHVRRYLYVFYALMFGTIVTVGASYIPFGNREINIGVALFIACSKAFLVAGFFMHLISERKMIYGILAFTAILFLGLMTLTVLSFADMPHHAFAH